MRLNQLPGLKGRLLSFSVTGGKWGQGSLVAFTDFARQGNMAADLSQFQLLLEGILSPDNDARTRSEVSKVLLD